VNETILNITHQAIFGGIAAAGFGILFNCPPRVLGLCFGAGALALAVRTAGTDAGFSLPVASFLAALVLAAVERGWPHERPMRTTVLSVVGCIPMVPGSLAAKGLINLFALLHLPHGSEAAPALAAVDALVKVAATLAAIGTALAIPNLLFPIRNPIRRREKSAGSPP